MSRDEKSSTHLIYEVDRLVDYAEALCRRYPPDGDPGADGFTNSPCDGAMREAALIHLRLLDSFLGAGKVFPDDVRARAWCPSWKELG